MTGHTHEGFLTKPSRERNKSIAVPVQLDTAVTGAEQSSYNIFF